MSLQDPAAFLFLSCALIAMSVGRGERWRAGAFLALNFLFLAMMFRHAPASLAFLLASVGVHYVTLRVLLGVRSSTLRVVIYWGWFLFTLAGFVVAKQYWWVTDPLVSRNVLPRVAETVGYSFLLFRQIHLAVEARDGARSSVPLIGYLNYNLAFWTFLAGPVQRFDPFLEQFGLMAEKRAPAREVLLGLNRTMLGFFKMFVIGELLSRQIEPTSATPQAGLVPFLVFPIHMYVNFSGYCDIMIGLARAVGFVLPENFRHPYLARNSLDFWSRWHITLSEFFRDYLYFPLHTSMSRRIPAFTSQLVATLCSFVVMGIWHGNSSRFAMFGLIHASGVIAVTIYQRGLKRWLTKEQLRSYNQALVPRVVAVVCFQSFVVLSFLSFRYEVGELPLALRSAFTGLW